jgi:Icc-related predicted phosphoesterase
MTACFFASDLHGHPDRYESLLEAIAEDRPEVVFLGGDLLPSGVRRLLSDDDEDFLGGLARELGQLRDALGTEYPRILLILGNDDGRDAEVELCRGEAMGLWEYLHGRRAEVAGFAVWGYAFVPPTPFLFKDWERYDVSRFVDPGCVSPEEGVRTVSVPENEVRFGTIARDLDAILPDGDLSRTVVLFHAPPHDSRLDRAALDGKTFEGVPLDLHIGSIAIRRFIEERQPHLTLHGHVHESTRLTGSFMEQLGRTVALQAAHDGPELCLLRFDLETPATATRTLLRA